MGLNIKGGPWGVDMRVRGALARKRGADVLQAIEAGMVEGARASIPTVQRFTPANRGMLRDSYQVQFRKNPRRAIVTTPLTYGPVMAAGRRPGRKAPPPGPIRAWVREKLGIDAARVNSVAYLIGRKMARFGIKIPLLVSGLGNMYVRAARALGPGFFSRFVTQRVSFVLGKVR